MGGKPRVGRPPPPRAAGFDVLGDQHLIVVVHGPVPLHQRRHLAPRHCRLAVGGYPVPYARGTACPGRVPGSVSIQRWTEATIGWFRSGWTRSPQGDPTAMADTPTMAGADLPRKAMAIVLMEEGLETTSPLRNRRGLESHWGSRRPDSNRGPAVYETAALPLSYAGRTGLPFDSRRPLQSTRRSGTGQGAPPRRPSGPKPHPSRGRPRYRSGTEAHVWTFRPDRRPTGVGRVFGNPFSARRWLPGCPCRRGRAARRYVRVDQAEGTRAAARSPAGRHPLPPVRRAGAGGARGRARNDTAPAAPRRPVVGRRGPVLAGGKAPASSRAALRRAVAGSPRPGASAQRHADRRARATAPARADR
jgi:hypothetical protein